MVSGVVDILSIENEMQICAYITPGYEIPFIKSKLS